MIEIFFEFIFSFFFDMIIGSIFRLIGWMICVIWNVITFPFRLATGRLTNEDKFQEQQEKHED